MANRNYTIVTDTTCDLPQDYYEKNNVTVIALTYMLGGVEYDGSFENSLKPALFYEKLRAVGMPTTSWTPLPVDGTFYIPSNDFSCMISTAMFEQFFLQGIVEECNYYDRSIYHLDGPDALRHLDLLLEIPSLDAVQWVFGAGNEGYARWIPVYQKIQAKRKSIQLLCDVSELPLVFETLRPEGVWFSQITGVEDEETAREVLRRIERWA